MISRTRTIIMHFAERPGMGLLLLLVAGLLQAAFAADPSIYTTHSDTTISNTVTDANGNISTSTSTTSRNGVNSATTSDAQNRHDAWRNDPNAAKFPYDSTGGANRSDVDTARTGFDDPRNPWDGRYSNDNPDNYPVGGSGNNSTGGANGSHLQGVVVNHPTRSHH